MAKEIVYINAPVPLLAEFMDDPARAVNDMIYYAAFRKCLHIHEAMDTDEIGALRAAFKALGFSNSDYNSAYDRGQELYNSIPDGVPFFGVSRDVIASFLDDPQDEFDRVCFLAFCGLKSIIGCKGYDKTYKDVLFGRMAGLNKSVKFLEDLPPGMHKYYSSRHYWGKLIKELENAWNLVYYSNRNKGFFVSFKLSPEELIYQAEKRRPSLKEKLKKQEMEEAKRVAMERVNKLKIDDLKAGKKP